MADRPLASPMALTEWFPGKADLGTLNLVENVPVGAVVAVATWVVPKSTATVSLAPNPAPFTVTLVVGGPTPAFRVMPVVAAPTGAAKRPRAKARTVPAAAPASSRGRARRDETPAITRAKRSGIVRILIGRVASWDVRTGCHLPPGRPAGSAGPVTGTAGPLASAEQPQVGAGTPLAGPSMTVGTG